MCWIRPGSTRPCGYLPQLLHPKPVGLRAGSGIQREAFGQHLGEAAARAFGDEGQRRAHFRARGVVGSGLAGLRQSHVADLHAGDRAVFVKQRFGRGESREHIHAEVFGLLAEPCREQSQRHDQIAVIVQMRPRGQADAAGARQQPEFIALGGNADAGRALAPCGQQCIQRVRFDDRAGQGMRADGCAFFQHAEVDVGLAVASGGWRRPDPQDLLRR